MDPGFVCGRVPTKPAFTQEEKAERLKFCIVWVEKPPRFWYQVIFFDEFTVYERPDAMHAIHRHGDGLFMTDARLNPYEYGAYGKLSICIAVNAYVGLVGYWWLHTTTGYDGRKTYWVSPPTLQGLHLILQVQLPIGVGVKYEAVRALPLGQRHSPAQHLSPLPLVGVVQPHQHVFSLPRGAVCISVHLPLGPHRLALAWFCEVCLAIDLCMHPPQPPLREQWAAEVERAVPPLEHFALRGYEGGGVGVVGEAAHKWLCRPRIS